MDEAAMVARACDGDRDALGLVLEGLREPLFKLATAMLWDRHEAEDVTQEALIAVMTNLSSFRGESSLSTWAHRIAVRSYLRRRRSPTESSGLSFASFAADLVDGLAAADSDRPDAELLAQEVRVGCTLGVLQCLDRGDRLTFVLGDVLGLPGEDAASILEISHDAFRKRLSRVRAKLRAFVSQNCGIVNPAARCRCARRVDQAVAIGRVDPRSTKFIDPANLQAATAEIADLHDAAALFRAAGRLTASERLGEAVADLLLHAPTLLADC